jgi:hypothetical protein
MPFEWVKPELNELGLEFASSMPLSERNSLLSTTLNRAMEASKGIKQKFNNQEIDPRYRISNQRLIEILEITRNEERQLKTIISKDEKRRRDRINKMNERREAGMQDRNTYLSSAEIKRAQARILRAQGKDWNQIAETVGYASATSARISVRE